MLATPTELIKILRKANFFGKFAKKVPEKNSYQKFFPFQTITLWLISTMMFIFLQTMISTIQKYDVNDKNFSPSGSFATSLNILLLWWFTHFTFGCQHFVIAGAVSKWYFSHDKRNLNSPIKTTLKNLIFYHMGSICVGTWIFAVLSIFKTVFFIFRVRFISSKFTIFEF